MKKNVPLLICVQTKNNLPSLSTAHWGRLVKKICLQRESQSAVEYQTTKQRENREGLRWKMEHKWEGRKAKKEEC